MLMASQFRAKHIQFHLSRVTLPYWLVPFIFSLRFEIDY